MADSLADQMAAAARRLLDLSGPAQLLDNSGAHHVPAAERVRAKQAEAEIAKLAQFLKTKNPAHLPAGFKVVPPATIESIARVQKNWK
ncbi:hypothetical protein ETQ85_04565 [Zoogloea oleivorans]|uniref:Uncharacterized protein n=1 Tax=Zoogloea oleivorans TaxID=1552750 RepID=A0A6C2D6S1_9RHOO|nr:hypothetical protein [Zoogloea oleivorans]TYC61332.1 hypothetical protein ETQ85_04565 [Zoogloea oleivorans]